MSHFPYVRLRQEDLPESAAIQAWTLASPELVEAVGLPGQRSISIPLAGRGDVRKQAREGFTTLLTLEPSHPDRTLYLEVIQQCFPGFERWLERRVGRAFSSRRYELALREAVALVNLSPGRAEWRFNLGLLLARLAGGKPEAPEARRWTALARGEFTRAAELSPELFWGHYHRGVLAYEAQLPEVAREDWLRFLDRYFCDKPAPRKLTLPLLPLNAVPESAELPGLAYTVLLDFLGLVLPKTPAAGEPQQSPV